MPASKPWSYVSTQDRLRIFVSSRLEECRDERTCVRDAIRSINHEPVLFEHIGARPVNARDLYLSRLKDSQAMVAVYRSGYGYIDNANDMTVSGLEDEYRFAHDNGIETLVYVARDPGERDPRLTALIHEASSHVTLSYYREPSELHLRVREDLTAVITTRFLSVEVHRGVLKETPHEILGRSRQRTGSLLRRESLIAKIDERLGQSSILCVLGPPGIGKTTLVAQFAAENDALFVRATGLAPKEVFSVCAATLEPQEDYPSSSYSTLLGARRAFESRWAELDSVTLVVDECEFVGELIAALESAGGVTASKKLIFTSREEMPQYDSFEVPPFNREEVDQFLGAADSKIAIDDALLEKGNPLALQQAFATAELASLPPGLPSAASRELLAYLSLTDHPLSAADLMDLLGRDNYSIEDLYADIKRLGRIVDDSPRGFQLMHKETATGQRREIAQSPQRMRFYGARLIHLFERRSDLRAAYAMAAAIDDGSERRLAIPALRQATQLGDWQVGVAIAERLLDQAIDADNKAEALRTMVSLVYPLELMGNAVRASELLESAKKIATELGAEALTAVEEVELASRVRRALSASDLQDLMKIYLQYGEAGREWDQARVGLELSALHMAVKDFEKAVHMLRPALEVFQRLGDEYGVDCVERNLAGALSNIPASEKEAEELIEKISQRAEAGTDSRRQRAWLCNLLVGRYRRAGRYAEAEELAKEAIRIGEELGDETLRGTNLVNLGNVYRNLGRLKDAISAYEEAVQSARKCARRDIEADALRLHARILNDFSTEQHGVADRRVEAKALAESAVHLLKGTVYHNALGQALLELAEAREGVGQEADGARTYFEAAEEFFKVPDDDWAGHVLLRGASVAIPDYIDVYLDGLRGVLGVDGSPEEALSEHFISLVRPIVLRVPEGALIPLFGMHLQCVRSHLPEFLRPPFIEAVINIVVSSTREADDPEATSVRLLHAALVLSFLMKEDPRSFLHARLAEAVTRLIDGIDAREVADGDRVWTVVLELAQPVTITIETLDYSFAASLAAFGLALFVKAFETDLRDELVSVPQIEELLIQVGTYKEMPESLRQIADTTIGTGEILKDQPCAVTRPTEFSEESPTFIVLADTFLDGVGFGEGRGGSLQMLFGTTLIEIVFQMLRGEVDADEIAPKVVSLVRRTIS